MEIAGDGDSRMSKDVGLPQPLVKLARLNLSSLPAEVITSIYRLIDTPTSLSLALVSRQFYAMAEYGLYRTITLDIPTRYPECPADEQNNSEVKSWELGRRKDAEECAERLKALARAMLHRLDERRSALVEVIKIRPRAGALAGAMAVLDLVSPTISILEIDPSAQGTYFFERLSHRQSIEYKFIDAGLSFPSLSTLRLGKSVLQYMDFPGLLCRAAPNLHSLDLDLTWSLEMDTEGHDEPWFPAMPVSSKIQQLRITPQSPFMDEDEEELGPVLDLLARCPDLRQIALDYDFWNRSMTSRMVDTLSQLDKLSDLYWLIELSRLNDAVNDGPGKFPKLRRLTVSANRDFDLFQEAPGLKTDVLFIQPANPPRWPPITFSPPHPAPAQHLVSGFAFRVSDETPIPPTIHFLRQPVVNDSLKVFELLDKIESTTEMGWVRLIRARGVRPTYARGLVHARLQLNHYEVADYEDRLNPGPDPPGLLYLQYFSYRMEQTHTKLFERTAEPVWLDFTDYRGHTVPLAVLEEMRAVEGMDEAEWEREKVTLVGGESWKVLADWYEEVKRAEAELEEGAELEAKAEAGGGQ